MSTRGTFAVFVALAGFLGACSDAVDLGGPTTGDALDNQGGASSGVSPPEGERVARLAEGSFADGLAIDDHDIYVSGVSVTASSLQWCSKQSCEDTLGPLEAPPDLSSIQVYEGRLAGSRSEGRLLRALASYALPRLDDEQLAIGGLPGDTLPVFHRGFVYWSLSVDRGVYRCRLPSCLAGPELLGQGSSAVTVAGRFAFWSGGSTIYRAPLDAPESAEALLADEELSLAPSGVENESKDVVEAMAASESTLYAAIRGEARATTRIVRWPVQGGPREVVGDSELNIVGLRVFGDELVWIATSPAFGAVATLFTCSAQDCAASQRQLGSVRRDVRNVTADATHLYWLAAEREPNAPDAPDPTFPTSPRLVDAEIRRIPLLSVP